MYANGVASGKNVTVSSEDVVCLVGGRGAPMGVEPLVLVGNKGDRKGEAEAETNAEDVGEVRLGEDAEVSRYDGAGKGDDVEEVSGEDDGTRNGFACLLEVIRYGDNLSILENCEEETCSANLTNLVEGKDLYTGDREKADEDGDVVKGGATEDESAVSTFAFWIQMEVCEEEGRDASREDLNTNDDGGGDDALTSRNSASM